MMPIPCALVTVRCRHRLLDWIHHDPVRLCNSPAHSQSACVPHSHLTAALWTPFRRLLFRFNVFKLIFTFAHILAWKQGAVKRLQKINRVYTKRAAAE